EIAGGKTLLVFLGDPFRQRRIVDDRDRLAQVGGGGDVVAAAKLGDHLGNEQVARREFGPVRIALVLDVAQADEVGHLPILSQHGNQDDQRGSAGAEKGDKDDQASPVPQAPEYIG